MASLRAFETGSPPIRDLRNRLLAGHQHRRHDRPHAAPGSSGTTWPSCEHRSGSTTTRRRRCSRSGPTWPASAGESAVDVADVRHGAPLDSIDPNDPMLPVWFHLPVAALTMIDRATSPTEVLDRTLTPARQAGAPAQVSVMLFQRGINAYRAGDLDDAESDARAALDVCVEHRSAVHPPGAAVGAGRRAARARRARRRRGVARRAWLHDQRPAGRLRPPAHCLAGPAHAARRVAGRTRPRSSTSGWERSVTAGCGSPGFVAWEAGLAEALVMCGRLARGGRPRPPCDRRGRRDRHRPPARRSTPRPGARGSRRRAARCCAARRTVQGARRPAGGGAYRRPRPRTGSPGPSGADGRRAHARTVARRAVWGHEAGRQLRSAISSRTAYGPRSRPVAGLGALTASERRVAALAGAGRTNKEIAQELFVTSRRSRRTWPARSRSSASRHAANCAWRCPSRRDGSRERAGAPSRRRPAGDQQPEDADQIS